MNEPKRGSGAARAHALARGAVTMAIALLLCTPLTMCGGAPQMAPAASPAQSTPETEDVTKGGGGAAPSGYPSQPGYGQPPPPPAAAPPPATSGPGESDAPQRRASARAEMDRAQGAFDAAASDCSAACRALASMERAADHLCELAGDPDDQRRCEDARRRVTAARERIRSACGTCP